MADGAFDLLDASLAMQVELVNDGGRCCVVFLGSSVVWLLFGFILRLLLLLP